MTMRFMKLGRIAHHLPALEEDDSVIAQVKGDKSLGVVGHGAPKSCSHNAVPIWIVFLVKFLFYIICNILKKATYYHSEVHNQQTKQPSKHVTSVY